jgi:hypothetical protein
MMFYRDKEVVGVFIAFFKTRHQDVPAQACSFRDQYEDFKDLGAGYRNQ